MFLRQSKLLKRDKEDLEAGELRQDRYSIRSASQWIGPALEDLVLAYQQVTIECNSITDNPIIDPSGQALHSANFQAKSVSSAMDKTRYALEVLGRILFSQCSEMCNPATNKSLPPNLVADEPSNTWLMKPIDVMIAALQGELGFLSSPVNHVHTAEMGNQSVHSLAMVSARYTHQSIAILSQLVACHSFVVCQALDLRAMNIQFLVTLKPAFLESITADLGSIIDSGSMELLHECAWNFLQTQLDQTMGLDFSARFEFVAQSLQPTLIKFIGDRETSVNAADMLSSLRLWTTRCANMMLAIFTANRESYFRNGDASPLLGLASSRMYTFIRQKLNIPFLRMDRMQIPEDYLNHCMHAETGEDSFLPNSLQSGMPKNSEGITPTTGEYVTTIYNALRNGILYRPAMESLREAQGL